MSEGVKNLFTNGRWSKGGLPVIDSYPADLNPQPYTNKRETLIPRSADTFPTGKLAILSNFKSKQLKVLRQAIAGPSTAREPSQILLKSNEFYILVFRTYITYPMTAL